MINQHIRHLRFLKIEGHSKQTKVSDWQTNEKERLTANEIEKWISSGNNYGVICGPITGVAVIDCDHKEFVYAVENNLPETFSVQSSSFHKRHFYYYIKNFPKDKTKIHLIDPDHPKDRTKQGGDIRYGNFYLVGPGSTHPDTRQKYKVIDDVPIATVDYADIQDLLKDYIKDHQKAPFEIPDKITEGARDDTIFKMACSLRQRNDLDFNQVLAAVSSYNHMSCEPPLLDNEVKVKVESAFKYKEKTEPTLLFAERLCDEHDFISVQAHGRIYKYDKSGVYRWVMAQQITGPLDNIIIKCPGGKRLTPAKRKNIIANISSLSYVDPEELNPEGFINFQNGVYDIKSKKLVPHKPEIYSTTQLNYEYDPNAMPVKWVNYLKSSLNNDINKIKLLQEFCGYCFLKTSKYEKALFLSGRGGTGKSTFTETIKNVFGGDVNCSSTSLKNLSDPTLRCSIRNKFINFDSDLPKNACDYEEVFKKITSGESIKFNEKFVPAVDESVRCKLVFSVNAFPYINDPTNAFYRRMILVKFDKEFDDTQADKGLKYDLLKERSGIFNWCIEGLERLVKNDGFSYNICMDNEIGELRKDNNPILDFIDSCIELKDNHCVSKSALWNKYKEWSLANGHARFLSFRNFCKKFQSELTKFGVESCQKTTGDRAAGWSGVDVVGIDIGFGESWLLQEDKPPTLGPLTPPIWEE